MKRQSQLRRSLTDSLAPMANIRDGTVYLSLVFNEADVSDIEIHWSGHCEFNGDAGNEYGPEFDDASDAVNWWRERGAQRIFIRLDFRETLWAGVGLPPIEDVSGEAMSVFDPTDPQGRSRGARKTVNEAQIDARVQAVTERVRASIDEGRRLARRREGIGLSVEELADRIGGPPEWIREVESGVRSAEVTMMQWIDLVWATRTPYPDERRSAGALTPVRWVAREGDYLAEAEVVVNEALGRYD